MISKTIDRIKNLKSKKILFVVLSHTVTAILFLLLGGWSVGLADQKLIKSTHDNAQELIYNSQQTYDLQRQITLNYKQSFDEFSQCILQPDICDPDNLTANSKRLRIERESLEKELYDLGKQTELILIQFNKLTQ